MRGWNRLIVLGVLLSVMLIISAVFGTGVVDDLMGGSSSAGEAAILSTPEVALDANTTYWDYFRDPKAGIGNTTQIHVNVTGATDLFAWQINVSWHGCINASSGVPILSVSNIIAGEFLNRVTPPNYTTSSPAPNGLGFVINMTDNVAAYTAMGESILGGVPAISGDGRLVTIEFLITGYGSGYLNISVGGILPTTLLNSTLDSIAFVTYTFRSMDGYFRNKLTGDSNGDGYVNSLDNGKINAHWTPAGGVYSRDVDNNDDGIINSLDDGKVNGNWLRRIFP